MLHICFNWKIEKEKWFHRFLEFACSNNYKSLSSDIEIGDLQVAIKPVAGDVAISFSKNSIRCPE